jgi:hypothetical protein
MSIARKLSGRSKPRHRPSERVAPRPSDFISNRILGLAAWMSRRGIRVEIESVAHDGHSLGALAEAHAKAEDELSTRFSVLRQWWIEHEHRTRAHEALLLRVLEALPSELDAEGKVAVRLARLRRPPLAKVRALVRPAEAEAHRTDESQAAACNDGGPGSWRRRRG